MKPHDSKETHDQNGNHLITGNFEDTCKEIAGSFEPFKSFLLNFGVPEKDIPAIEYIINENDSPIKNKNCTLIPELYVKLKNLNFNDKDIYSIIWPELIKNYAWIVDKEGTILSAYLIKSIINRKNTHEISEVNNLFEKYDKDIGLNGLNGLSIDEIKEILKILINFYNNYIRERDNNYIRERDNNYHDWITDGYKKTLKFLERKLGSLEDINLENSKTQTDVLEQRILYYLRKYSEINSKDSESNDSESNNSESKDYLRKKIFGDDQMNGFINVNDIRFSRNLFTELLKYQEFYKILMQNLDKFLLKQTDYKNFFDLIIERKCDDELKTLKSSIDDFEGLEDKDYIELYLSLYPGRRSKTLVLEPSQIIERFIDHQIGFMEKKELKDFIDLIKTTQYRINDVSNKCYEILKSKGMYRCLVENYTMGYFKQIMKDKIFNDISDSDEKLHIIRGYLPIFFQLEKAREHVNKILAKGNIDLSSMDRCFELMKNRETLEKGLRGRIN